MLQVKEHSDNVLIVKPDFNIDIENIDSVVSMKEQVLEWIKKTESPVLIIDLENCDYIDSTGLGNIIRIYEQLRRKQGSFLAVNVNDNVNDIFEITTINKLIQIYLTLDEALESLK